MKKLIRRKTKHELQKTYLHNVFYSTLHHSLFPYCKTILPWFQRNNGLVYITLCLLAIKPVLSWGPGRLSLTRARVTLSLSVCAELEEAPLGVKVGIPGIGVIAVYEGQLQLQWTKVNSASDDDLVPREAGCWLWLKGIEPTWKVGLGLVRFLVGREQRYW